MRFSVALLLSVLLLTREGSAQLSEHQKTPLNIVIENRSVALPAFAYQPEPDGHPIENQPASKDLYPKKELPPSDDEKSSSTTESTTEDPTKTAASTVKMGDSAINLGYRQRIIAAFPEAKATPEPKTTKVESTSTTSKLSLTTTTKGTIDRSTTTSTSSSTTTVSLMSSGSTPVTVPQGTVSVTINVLATEISYGVGNPMTAYLQPAFIPSSGGPAPTFPEVQVGLGYTDTLTISEEGELQLFTRATYGSYQTAITSSDDPVYAIIVANGDNLNDLLAAKNVQPAFGMQASIESILGSMYDAETGIVTLPENSVLVLYEMSRTAWSSIDDDYNDAMVLVTFDAPVTTEIVLRSSIGEESQQLVGSVAASSGWNAGQSSPAPMFPIAVLNAPQQLTLSSLDYVVGRLSISGNVSAQQYRLRIWRDPGEAVANQLSGTVYDIPIVPYQVQNFGALANGRLRHLVSFDLTAHNIVLPAGEFVFNLAVITPNSSFGLYGYVEGQSDSIPSSSDYGVGGPIPPPGYGSLCPGPTCVWTGKFASKLIAVPVYSPEQQ